MGKILNLVGIVVAASLIKKTMDNKNNDATEYEKRVQYHCDFEDGITEEEFNHIVNKACEDVNRLDDYHISGAVVYGEVVSITGYTRWKFELDFNDYGHLTGNYWIYTDNDESRIPHYIANSICSMINNFPNSLYEDFEDEMDGENEDDKEIQYCPYCGEKLINPELLYCQYCRKHV